MLSSIAFSTIDDLGTQGNAGRAALTEGYADAFMAGSGIGLLGIIATLVLIRDRDSRAHVDLGDGSDPVPAPSGSLAPDAPATDHRPERGRASGQDGGESFVAA